MLGVEIFPVPAKQRQKDGMQIVELEQNRKMTVSDGLLWLYRLSVVGHVNHLWLVSLEL